MVWFTADRRSGSTLRVLTGFAILLGAVVPGTAEARDRALFEIPLAYVSPQESGIDGLAAALDIHSRAIQGIPATGYDWVFPAIYSKVTRRIGEGTRQGVYLRPDVMRDEMVQFYEIFVRNSNLWTVGDPAEAHWRRVARLSRALASSPPLEDNEARGAATLIAFLTIYTHVAIDLPRALAIVQRRHQPAVAVDEMKEDFDRATSVFTPVTEEIVREGRVGPRLLARVWDDLPRWLRRALISTELPLGTGAYIRALRAFAFWRFRRMLKNPDYRDEILRFPSSTVLTPFVTPVRGDPVPALPRVLDAEETERLEILDAQWERFLAERPGER